MSRDSAKGRGFPNGDGSLKSDSSSKGDDSPKSDSSSKGDGSPMRRGDFGGDDCPAREDSPKGQGISGGQDFRGDHDFPDDQASLPGGDACAIDGSEGAFKGEGSLIGQDAPIGESPPIADETLTELEEFARRVYGKTPGEEWPDASEDLGQAAFEEFAKDAEEPPKDPPEEKRLREKPESEEPPESEPLEDPRERGQAKEAWEIVEEPPGRGPAGERPAETGREDFSAAWSDPQSPLFELERRPEQFSYFQALRLLALSRRAIDGSMRKTLRRAVTIRADLSMAFPASDLVDVERLEEPGKEEGQAASHRKRLTVSFMGLYGSASPLPPTYSKRVIDEALDDFSAIRDLLDLISLPSYINHAEAHFHQQLPLRLMEEGDVDLKEILFSLAGLGHRSLRADRGDEVLMDLLLIPRHVRSARGLSLMLRRRMDLNKVDLRQCEPRVVRLGEEDKIRLGLRGTLGHDAVLGREARDFKGKFAVLIGVGQPEGLISLMPGGERRSKIEREIAEYLQEPLICDLILRYRPGAERGAVLGEGKFRSLGVHAFVAPPERRLYRLVSPVAGERPWARDAGDPRMAGSRANSLSGVSPGSMADALNGASAGGKKRPFKAGEEATRA